MNHKIDSGIINRSRLYRRSNFALHLKLLITLLLASSVIHAQATDYFPFNQTMRSVYFTYYYTIWGLSSSSYGLHVEMGIVKDTLAGGRRYYAFSDDMLVSQGPSNLSFYRMGEDMKFYFLSPQGEKLMFDFSDTSKITYQAYIPDITEPVAVTREQTVNGVELKFSFRYVNQTRWFKFRKGLGFFARNFWISNGRGYSEEEVYLAEFFMTGAAGDTIKYTSNKKPEFKEQSYQWLSDRAVKLRTVVKHLYYPYYTLAGVKVPYIEKVSVEYRYARPKDSTAIQTVTLQKLNDTLSFELALDTVKLWQGYSFLYRFRATTRGIYPTSAVYPANNSYYRVTYTNPDTGFTLIHPFTAIRYDKFKVKPGTDPVLVGEYELIVYGDTLVAGTSYRIYQFGGKRYYAKLIPVSGASEYYEKEGGKLVFAGKDSLPAFANKTGRFRMGALDSLSFSYERMNHTYGVSANLRRYEQSNGNEFVMILRNVGPVQFQVHADSSAPGEYTLYKTNRIVYGGKEVYADFVIVNPPVVVKPKGIRIDQNYPNPVVPGSSGSGSGATTIRFYSDQDAMAELQFFTTSGELIYHASKETKAFEENSFVLNAINLPSGVYIYRITVGDKTETKKMLVVR
ncbi:MAG: T9SS C-terminal target domain-containing protein [Chlorobiota bacterium]|nr:MAG: T9SS C-terminal target domain-containing protein [Chlorobiota bacterium]